MKNIWTRIACALIVCVMMISVASCAAPADTDLYVTEDQLSDINFELLASSSTVNLEGLDPLVADALAINNGIELKFDENGEFKIIFFSDIQDGTGSGSMSAETLSWMSYFIDTQKPDLVLMPGDVFAGHMTNLKAFKTYISKLQGPMAKYNVPWGQVYGNHEEGGHQFDCGIYKEDETGIYMDSPLNVSKNGNVPGNANYVLPVLRNDGSGKIGYNIFCLDSQDYVYKYGDTATSAEKMAEKDTSSLWANNGYDYNDYSFEAEAVPGKVYNGNKYEPINFEQIKWYWDTSVALQEYNGQENPITAMMMFHIPLYEMNYILNNPTESGFEGIQYDPISAAELSAGLFWALYERGDVNLLVHGHDHINGFTGQYMGITMAYCATIGDYQYHDATVNGAKQDCRGVRVVTIKQGANVGDPCTFTTEMIYVKDINGGKVPSGY